MSPSIHARNNRLGRRARRNIIHHRAAIRDFYELSIGVVLERLSNSGSQPVGAEFSSAVIRTELEDVIWPLSDRYDVDAEAVSHSFAYDQFDSIVSDCIKDANRYPLQDPALENLDEVFYASNGFHATIAYRIANALLRMGVPVLPRTISSIAHSQTGIDIHPGTTIAPGLFIDHGTGIAIGCTAVIGENVNLYNGVVLGTRSKPRKKIEGATGSIQKRHPTIESGVSLYTSSFVGGDVVIGAGATIGAYAFVCRDVDPGVVVLGKVDSDVAVAV